MFTLSYFKQVFYAFSLILFFFIFGCKRIQPSAPPENYLSTTFTPEISEINIPIEISIPGMENSINSKIAGLLYEDNDLNNNNEDNLLLKVWKQDNISIDVKGNDVFYKVPLKLWVKAGWKIDKFGIQLSQFYDGECALAIKFKSKLSIDSTWKVSSKTESNGYEWINKPKVKLGDFSLPVTYIADRILNSQQDKLAKIIDRQVAENLNIKKYIEEVWSKIQNPIAVSKEPEVWLSIKPMQAQITPFVGKTGKISSSIGLTAYAKSWVGQKPEISATKLSNLKLINAPTNQFAISLASDISYPFATEMAKKFIQGETYFFKDGKYKITVNDINIYGSGKKLVLNLLVDGSIKGNIYLTGLPIYDAGSNSLLIKELEYDLDTKDKLIKSADWLAHGSFVKKIESYLKYPLDKEINSSKDLIQKSLTNKRISNNILLNGKIVELVPQQVLITPESIKTIVKAKGKLEVKIEGFE